MLARLKEFLGQVAPDEADDDYEVTAPLAAAVLLLEVAWADHDIADDEVDFIRTALHSGWGLDEEAISSTLDRARELHDTSAGVYPFTRMLCETCTREERCRVLGNLWRLARFDGDQHRYEEAAIRKIADLLHLTHAEFIAAKLSAPMGGQAPAP